MKSDGRRRRKSEEKASWLGREALTNIASDKCALAHLTAHLETANFQHRVWRCGYARCGLHKVQPYALRARLPCIDAGS